MSHRRLQPTDPFADRVRDYDRWYHTSRGAFIDAVETELAFELCPPVPGERTLDAGCGTGNFARKLVRRGCRVTGVDISAAMLAAARAHADREGISLRLIRGNLCDLPLPGNTYDSIYSMTAVEFVPDLAAAHAELMRVLRPGGRLLVGTVDGDGPWGRAYARRAREKPDSIFRFARFPTPGELRAPDPENVVASGECLYVPPDAPEDAFAPDEERRRRAAGAEPGFFCVLWRKPTSGGGAP